MASEAEFFASFEKIKDLHRDAFVSIDQAIRNEEAEKPVEALKDYKKGIEIIDKALATPVGLPDDVQSVRDQWNNACKMIHKLKRARAEVVQRVGTLNGKYGPAQIDGHEAVDASEQLSFMAGGDKSRCSVENENGRPRTYAELAQALRQLQCVQGGVDSLELIFSCEGVKLYQIKPNGIVTTTSDDSVMRIIRLDKDEKKHLNTTFFIQIIKSSNAVPIRSPDSVESPIPSTSFSAIESEKHDEFNAQEDSSWIYPLVPGVSPCFRTEYGAFIFPDLESSEAGSSFGIMVPTENKADEIVLEILEAILHGVVMQLKEGDERRALKDISATVSEDIVRGAHFISQNLVRGAEKAGEFMSYSTPYLISKLRGAAPDSPPVSENVQTTVQVARSVTGAAVGVTGYIAGKVGSATMSLGRFLAPHIQKHGSTLLSKGFGVNEEVAQEKMAGVLTIAAGAVEGFGTVYYGLEESAKILGNNISNNSVKIIEHKYGPSAGSLASGTFDTVGNVINLSQNVRHITPKGLAKGTAKNAGKAFVEDFRPKPQNGSYLPAASLYPDLTTLEAQVKK